MSNEITVCISVHPPRIANGMLHRALASVWTQTLRPDRVVIQVDNHREGGAVTHNRMIQGLTTPWAAFLDSDDELHPQHLERLLETALETGADVVYPWFDLPIGTDPLGAFGRPFDPDDLQNRNYIPVTVLARTTKLQETQGFTSLIDPKQGTTLCEEWFLWKELYAKGGKFVHLAERTWIWHWHGYNTSSNPNSGDANY